MTLLPVVQAEGDLWKTEPEPDKMDVEPDKPAHAVSERLKAEVVLFYLLNHQ